MDLNGKTRRQIVKLLGDSVRPLTKGVFSDDCWQPVHKILAQLDESGIHLQKALYGHDAEGTPTSKTWTLAGEFQSPSGSTISVTGVLVASGAGSVEDPLSRYDLVGYFN